MSTEHLDIEQATDSMMAILSEHVDTVDYLSRRFNCSAPDIITAAMLTGFDVAMRGSETAFRRNLERTIRG